VYKQIFTIEYLTMLSIEAISHTLQGTR